MMWKVIPSFPDYEASEDGHIRRGRPGVRQKSVAPLKPFVEKNGYVSVTLWVSGKTKKAWLHILVCEAHYGLPPSPEHQAAHGDGVRTNCCATNLSWKPRKQNYQDQIAHGTSKRGGGNHMVRLTEAQVREIKIRADSEPHAALANQYGISERYIRRIRRGEAWSHLWAS